MKHIKNKIKKALLEVKSNKGIYRRIKYSYPNLYCQILKQTGFLKDDVRLTERIYCILNNIVDIKKCKKINCENKAVFYDLKNGYRKYCSIYCHNTCDSFKTTRKQTNLKKYGVENTFQSKECREKIKQTRLKKSAINIVIKNKIKKEKFELEKQIRLKEINIFKTLKEKIEFLLKERSDVKHISYHIKAFYGDLYDDIIKRTIYLKNGLFTERIYHILNDLKYILKCNNEKCDNAVKFISLTFGYQIFCSNMCYLTGCSRKESIKNRSVEFSQKIKQKEYKTKKKNGTFKSSKQERQLLKILQNIYPDTIHQYKSVEYPFNCDFYIPSKKLYIELNLHWTRGSEAFDENKPEHIALIETWKKRSKELNLKGKKKTYYKNAIKVWTKRDVKKRVIASKNNLNYVEIFNLKDFNLYLL